MKRYIQAIIQFVVTLIIVTNLMAAPGEDQILAQFSEPLIIGSGGSIASVTILIPSIELILQQHGAQTIVPVFEGKPKQVVRNGYTVKLPNFDDYYLISFPSKSNAEVALANMVSEPSVRSAELNSLYSFISSCENPNDSNYSDQWFMAEGEYKSGFEGAWKLACEEQYGGGDTKVGIFDQRVVQITDELVCENGYPPGSNPGYFHGTEVYGIIAGKENGYLISGAARNTSGRTYDCTPNTITITEFGMLFQQARNDDGCNVMCSSVGIGVEDEIYDPYYQFSHTMFKFFVESYALGYPFIGAAGNEYFTDHVVYPGGFGRYTISVGAHNQDGYRPEFSNYGPHLDLVAPGVEIPTYSLPNITMVKKTGTSYAQPLVTSAITLMRNLRPDLEIEDYEGIIKTYCSSPAEEGEPFEYGAGILDAGRAVQNLTGVYEVQHSQITGAQLGPSSDVNFKYLDFETGGTSYHAATMNTIVFQVTWETAFIDSVGAWGMVAGSNGLEPTTEYYHNGTLANWVTSLPFCKPIAVSNSGGTFETYTYVLRNAAGDSIGVLGPSNPADVSIRYGVIGKVREPYPAPEISPTAEYPVLRGGTDKSIFAVHVENNGSSQMTVFADLTNLGGDSDVQLWDNGVEPDLVAGDWVFTAPSFTSNVAADDYSVSVTAQGDIGLQGQKDVAVEVIDSGVLFVDGSDDTDELDQLLGEPYTGVYFDSPVDGLGQNLLMITKDSGDVPEVFRRDGVIDGAPKMEKKNHDWFQIGAVPEIGSRGIYAADFDNDGDEDLLICHNNQETRLYVNTGNGFIDSTSGFFGSQENLLNGAHVAAWGDYNQDGKLDLFVATMDYTGPISALADNIGSVTTPQWHLFKNTGTAFEKDSDAMSISGGLTLSASWNDVNNDGLLDLVVGELQGRTGGSPTVILNEGYKKNLGYYRLSEDPLTICVEGLTVNSLDWIDYNHDNYPDLIVTDFDPELGARILRNTGNGFVEAVVLESAKNWTGAVVADYNQDGQDDVVLLPSSKMPSLFIGDHSANPTFKELAYPLGLRDGATSGGLTADFNNDDDPDLYLGRENTDEFLYKNQRVGGTDDPAAAGQNWIRFDLTTMGNCNASMIGTRVTVDDGSKQWIQTVDGGSGRGGQRTNELHFGLGNVVGTVDVIVDWPGSYPPSPITYSSLAINTAHAIADTARPYIIVGSSQFLPEPSPAGADWVFEWRTMEHGDVELDKVEIDFGSYLPGDYCFVGPDATLEFGTSDVEMTIFPVLPSGWKHRVVWSDQSCLGDSICGFQFKVESGIESPQGMQTLIEGPWVDFGEFDICITKKNLQP